MKSLKESLLNRNKVTGNTLDNMYKDELKQEIEEFILNVNSENHYNL